MSVALHSKVYGKSEQKLYILHGLLGSLDNWQSLAKEWEGNGFEVHSIDLRNHGRSPHTNEHTITGMAEDVLAYADKQQHEKFNILGHSMGGKVVCKLLVESPNRIQKAIIADITPREYPAHHNDVFFALGKLDLNAEGVSRSDLDNQLSQYIPETGVRQFLLKNIDRKKQAGYEFKFNFEVLKKDYSEIIHAIEITWPISTPTLFIRGEQSGYITDDDIMVLEEQFTHSKFETISNAGHWVHAEQPKAVHNCVYSFLTS